MTIDYCKRFLSIYWVVFLPVTLIDMFGEYTVKFIEIPAFWLFILFANSILALTLLYFGIYARVSGIRKEPKYGGPFVYIIIGCLLVLVSFVSPILSVYMSYGVEKSIAPIQISSDYLEKQKREALDASVWSSIRLSFAEHYYLETGESIEYLDVANQKKIYVPDKRTKDGYEENLQMSKEIRQVSRFARINGIAHGVMLLLSVPTYLLFIRYKKTNCKVNAY